jgi:hypothetical protein
MLVDINTWKHYHEEVCILSTDKQAVHRIWQRNQKDLNIYDCLTIRITTAMQWKKEVISINWNKHVQSFPLPQLQTTSISSGGVTEI